MDFKHKSLLFEGILSIFPPKFNIYEFPCYVSYDDGEVLKMTALSWILEAKSR